MSNTNIGVTEERKRQFNTSSKIRNLCFSNVWNGPHRARSWQDKPHLLRFAEEEPNLLDDLLIMPADIEAAIKTDVNTQLVGKNVTVIIIKR